MSVDIAEIVSKISQNLSPEGGNVIVLILNASDAGDESELDDYKSAEEVGDFLWPHMGGGSTPTPPADDFWELSDGSGNFGMADNSGDWMMA